MKKGSKRLIAFLVVMALTNLTLIPIANALEPEVVVEICVGTYSTEEIEAIQFDDGTYVGDYNYVVKYRPEARLGSILTLYFNQIAWITRDGVLSLSLDPTTKVRTDRTELDTAWGYLSNTEVGLGQDSRWSNDPCFYWQYLCHFQYAKYKSVWNLEPSSTADSFAYVVARGCNP